MRTTTSTRQLTKTLWWTLYLLLIALRFYGAIYSLPGYIHPDEFFQGGQELFFGQQFDLQSPTHHVYNVKNVPWEFEPSNAVRSIVPPMFMTLLPLRVYAYMKDLIVISQSTDQCNQPNHQSPIYSFLWSESMNQLSGREVLVIPRIFICFVSLILLDGSMWLLTFCGQHRKNKLHIPPTEVILLASSWPCLVFGIRPFTNTLEAMCLAVLLVVINLDVCKGQKRNGRSSICIGIMCSVGIFVRFTFAFFAFPVVLIWIWHKWNSRFIARNFIYNMTWLMSAFLATSAMFILVDSKYYSWKDRNKQSGGVMDHDSILGYITPLNALLYNSKSTNLAEHGLHPRITHSLVNIPILFGPLAVVLYTSTCKKALSAGNRNKNSQPIPIVVNTCHWAIFSGLFVLSCAPHQEVRFLFPCIVPVILVCTTDAIVTQRRATFIGLWTVFNFVLYTFFGWLHQGGLAETLLHISNTSNMSSSHIFYKTYMPPSFLTRQETYSYFQTARISHNYANINDDGTKSYHNNEIQKQCSAPFTRQYNNRILDLQGNEPNVLLNVLHGKLPCTNGEDNPMHVHLVTPYSVASSLSNENDSKGFTWQEYKFTNVYISPCVHVSTEDWPNWNGSAVTFLNHLQLVVYEVTCMKAIAY